MLTTFLTCYVSTVLNIFKLTFKKVGEPPVQKPVNYCKAQNFSPVLVVQHWPPIWTGWVSSSWPGRTDSRTFFFSICFILNARLLLGVGAGLKLPD